jgi:hypothetical protein
MSRFLKKEFFQAFSRDNMFCKCILYPYNFTKKAHFSTNFNIMCKDKEKIEVLQAAILFFSCRGSVSLPFYSFPDFFCMVLDIAFRIHTVILFFLFTNI